METRYLYRGTTVGWPGNPVLQSERITCATTDPLVATLFAVECRNYGPAVILAARWDRFLGSDAEENLFSVIENALNVGCTPLEFVEQAEVILDVDRAIAILRDLGFNNVPVRLSGKSALQQQLEESHLLGFRLNPDQLARFNGIMRGDME